MTTPTSPYLVEARLDHLRERRRAVNNLIRALDRYQETRTCEKKPIADAKTQAGGPAWGVHLMAS